MKLSVAVLSVSLVLLILALLVPSPGQPPAKAHRVGWFTGGAAGTDPRVCLRPVRPFRQAWNEVMRDRGYVEGQNLTVMCRHTDGKNERVPAFATELVNLKPDVIIAANTNQVRALKSATNTIPIVMYGVIDPVRRGLVGSLARPGGNVTGLTDDAGLEILGKYLELLRQAVPTAARFAALHAPPSGASDPATAQWASLLEAEARILGVTLQSYYIGAPDDLEVTFGAITKARAEALLVVPSPFFAFHRQRVVDLAARSRLPAMHADRDDVVAGGLMAYTQDDLETARRLADYVDRILKGAKPGELPVEQPSKFALIFNLKTAKALGLTIPSSLLIHAEEVIR